MQPALDPRISAVDAPKLLQGPDGLFEQPLLQKEVGLSDALLKGLAVAVLLLWPTRLSSGGRF